MSLTVDCARCGRPLPPLSDDEARLFLSGGGAAVVQHPPGQCPHELAAAEQAAATGPRLRTFEATVTIHEVFPAEERRELLTDFVASAQAPSAVALMAAGGPLADAVGTKWQQVGAHIGFADVPAVPLEADGA